MTAVSSLRCSVHLTAELSRESKLELFLLAREAAGADFDPTYLERRLDLYPSVVLARDVRGLAAFALVDTRSGDPHLIYFGPLFSRRGAYVGLFACFLERWLDSAERFCIAMEIENPLVADVLAMLLPTSAQPRRDEAPPENIAALARLFATSLPHFRDFDERTMTTAITESASGRSIEGARYQLALISCAGDEPSREALRRELAHGLEGLELARRGPGISTRGHDRERDLLRANS